MPDDSTNNVSQNYVIWNNRHDWPQDGDEWTGQAELCGVSYSSWKDSLVSRLILPNAGCTKNVLEIGPGHGRWSSFLIPNSAFCTLVDLSPNCLDYCRMRFSQSSNVEYFLTTGTSLPRYCDAQIDFVWSYDSFVHMSPGVIARYVAEIARVLRPTAVAIIHHANIRDLSSHCQDAHPGWRSAVDNALLRSYAQQSRLMVEQQFVYWDEDKKIGVPNHGDSITVFRRVA